MLAAFDRVVESGAPELVLVSGYSGIGKSSVVNELHKALVPPRGFFASGKFDQLKRDIPYSTLAQAFRSLVRPLLGKSDAELARWRDALLEALGPNGRLMTDLVPELKLIIGDQPPVPELEPQQAQAPLPAGVPALHRRVRKGGTSAGAVPRRSSMAGRGDARPHRGSSDPSGPATPRPATEDRRGTAPLSGCPALANTPMKRRNTSRNRACVCWGSSSEIGGRSPMMNFNAGIISVMRRPFGPSASSNASRQRVNSVSLGPSSDRAELSKA